MWENELRVAIRAVLQAKEKIMEIYVKPFDVEIKEDDSPVTLADKTADELIRRVIAQAYPTHAFLTEESSDDKSRLQNDYVWIVDPVDGTKDFVDKNGEFTTNVALAYKHEVVVGVVLVPATGELYYATKGAGSYYQQKNRINKIHVNDKVKGLTVLTSRFHVNELELATIEKHKNVIKHRNTFGSAIKPCRIARGLAELSYRLSSGTKEWDTAASQIIVEEAGGVFVKPNGERILYNRDDVYNREGYVVANRIENVLL
ncbi:MAG: 3'(2'),5'-bisphosphate nucleotidase CysQ [Bacteroidia bacterium]|nr:3'(2'),5'-bisphosphate nucleotidase CysQ [Bacteroidia bacterium]